MRITSQWDETDTPGDRRNFDEVVHRLQRLKKFLPSWVDEIVVMGAPPNEEAEMILGLSEGDFFNRSIEITVGKAWAGATDHERHLACIEETAHMLMVPLNVVVTALRDFSAPGLRQVAKKVGSGMEEFAVKDLVRILNRCDCECDQALRTRTER